MKNFASFLFLFLTVIVFGQNKLITGGIVIDDGGEYASTAGIKVENLRSYAKTYSNYDGHFSIQASIGDTIQFSSSFLEPRKIVINPNLYEKGVMKVHLDIETIQLSETFLGKLDKNLQNNIGYRGDLKGDIYNNIGLDQRLRDLEPRRDISKFKPLDILNPVRVIGHINGFYKKQRKIQEFERKQNILNEVINFFPDEFFLDDLKIPDYKVHEFLQYADKKIDLKSKVLNRQFELIGLELEPIAELYLKELNQS